MEFQNWIMEPHNYKVSLGHSMQLSKKNFTPQKYLMTTFHLLLMFQHVIVFGYVYELLWEVYGVFVCNLCTCSSGQHGVVTSSSGSVDADVMSHTPRKRGWFICMHIWTVMIIHKDSHDYSCLEYIFGESNRGNMSNPRNRHLVHFIWSLLFRLPSAIFRTF